MRRTRHSVSGPEVDVLPTSNDNCVEGSRSGDREAITETAGDGAASKQRRKTVSGGEEGIIVDRNVSPRLGFLSYNTMKLKRRKSRKRMAESAEWLYPIAKTDGLEAGENNKMMTRTKYTLEALLIANNMAVVSAIVKTMFSTEVEEVGGALLAVFHCNGKGHKLILWAMERELKIEKVPGNLFRGISLAASLMSKYFRMSATDYLCSILRPVVKDIKSKDIRIEVDPARLAQREDQTETLRENQLKLIHFSKLVFDLLVASLDQFPSVLKNIFNEALQAINERFPDMGHRFVGSFYFLRFICPALVAPATYGLVKEDLTSENQRTLILISKVLQNLSNHNHFGEKEPFMMFMNPFITKNSQKMSDCLQALVRKVPENPGQTGKFFQMSATNEKFKNEALVTVTRCICNHLDDVLAELDRSGQSKLNNVLLDSIRALSTLARSAGVDINHAALAARSREVRLPEHKTRSAKSEVAEITGEDKDVGETDEPLLVSDDAEDHTPDASIDSNAAGSPQKTSPSSGTEDRKDLPNSTSPSQLVSELPIGDYSPASSDTSTPVVTTKKRLSLQFESESLALARRHSAGFQDDQLARDLVTGEAARAKSPLDTLIKKTSVSLSLGDIPTRESKEKEKEKMHRKIERAHRFSNAISPRETPVMNPIYNQLIAVKPKVPLADNLKDHEPSRYVKLKQRIGSERGQLTRERRASTSGMTRSSGDLTDHREEQAKEKRTENVLLQYLKDKEKIGQFNALRSDQPPEFRDQVPLDKRRSLSALDMKDFSFSSADSELASITSKASQSEEKRSSLEKELSQERKLSSQLHESLQKEEARRVELELELSKIKSELENERRMRLERELKLKAYESNPHEEDKQSELLEAERVKRLEAEMRLEVERERWSKLKGDANEIENERRKRIEAEVMLRIEREQRLEDVRQLEIERRKRIEAETLLDMERRMMQHAPPQSPSNQRREVHLMGQPEMSAYPSSPHAQEWQRYGSGEIKITTRGEPGTGHVDRNPSSPSDGSVISGGGGAFSNRDSDPGRVQYRRWDDRGMGDGPSWPQSYYSLPPTYPVPLASYGPLPRHPSGELHYPPYASPYPYTALHHHMMQPGSGASPPRGGEEPRTDATILPHTKAASEMAQADVPETESNQRP